MSALHTTPAEIDALLNRRHYPVDMNLVATVCAPVRRWHIEFDCQGAVFIWDGAAANENDATGKAWKALYMEGGDLEASRIVICLERRA